MEDSDDEFKEHFYDKLEAEYDATPKNNVKIVIGDFNAKSR